MSGKIFVTQEHFQNMQNRIMENEKRLEEVRAGKADAYQGDTNAWHDNFDYENLTRIEKMVEKELFDLAQDVANCVICKNTECDKPETVGLWTLVKISEANVKTQEEREKTIGIVPIGGENLKKNICNYNAPVIAQLMGAGIGDIKRIKIPLGEFKIKILEIQKISFADIT